MLLELLVRLYSKATPATAKNYESLYGPPVDGPLYGPPPSDTVPSGSPPLDPAPLTAHDVLLSLPVTALRMMLLPLILLVGVIVYAKKRSYKPAKTVAILAILLTCYFIIMFLISLVLQYTR
ncbi:MAG: hypothetical protein LBD25_07685 [Coriobacteriales bacterium]|jgi:hypothetical protein|nr:hypothetical protein [Coriobacteriales bacterium]